MYPDELRQLEERLYSQLPVIGKFLRQQAAQALAQDSSPDAVRVLTKAVTRSEDRQVLEIALNALRQTKKQQCVDEVCAVWAVTRHKDLANLLTKKGWIASASADIKVLSALKVGQLEVVTKGGTEVVEPLLKAFSDVDNEIANRAKQCAIALTNSDTVDYLCKQWSETRDRLLEQVILQAKYVARQPTKVRVLSALKLEQLEVLKQGKAEVVTLLLQACQDADRTIAKNAQMVLRDLKNPEAQESLCRLVIDQDHQLAREVAVASQYVPRDPKQLALYLFLTEQWDRYESLDSKHTLLQTAYELGDEQLRKRIAQKARQACRVEWVQVVTGGLHRQRLGKMTDAEWETTLAVLSQGKHWEEMLQLALKAPIIWSIRLLQKLKETGWVPKAEVAELVRLGQNCTVDLFSKPSRLWRCWKTLIGNNTTSIHICSISSDGQLLATTGEKVGTGEKIIELWNLSDGKLLQTISDNSREALIGFTPKGQLFAKGNSAMKLWSLPSGKPLPTLNLHFLYYASAISPDGELLVSCATNGIPYDPTIYLRNLPDGKLLKTLEDYGRDNDRVRGLIISPNSRMLVSGRSGRIDIWSLPDLKLLRTIEDPTSIGGRVISPDGKVLVSLNTSSSEGATNIKLWSLSDGKLLRTIDGAINRREYFNIAITPNGQTLFYSELTDFDSSQFTVYTQTIKFWNLSDGRLLQTLKFNPVHGVDPVISSNMQLYTCKSKDGKISLWSLPDGKLLQTLSRSTSLYKESKQLAISPDGQLLVVNCRDNTMELWKPYLHYLSHLSAQQISAEDLEWIQEALQNKDISESERSWLEYILALHTLGVTV